MEDLVIRINDMLMADDAEMRELGRAAIQGLPEETPVLEKLFLLCNANEPYVCLEAVKIFKKQSMGDNELRDLIKLMIDNGFNTTVAGALRSIESISGTNVSVEKETICSNFFSSDTFQKKKKIDYDMKWKKN